MQKQKLSSCMTSHFAQAGNKLSGLLSDSYIPPHHLTPSLDSHVSAVVNRRKAKFQF